MAFTTFPLASRPLGHGQEDPGLSPDLPLVQKIDSHAHDSEGGERPTDETQVNGFRGIPAIPFISFPVSHIHV